MSILRSIINDKFFKGGSTIFLTSIVGNVANYLFQFFMSRKLSVEDFGIMNSLFSLCVITGIPGAVILLVMAKYTSEYKALEQKSELNHFYLKALKTVAICAGIIFLIFSALSPFISGYLKINSNMLVVILGSMLFVSFIAPVNMGVLQGLQMFGYLGVAGALGGVLRLLLGAGFIYLGFKVTGAISASVLSGFILFVITCYPLRSFYKKNHVKNVFIKTKEVLSYSFPVFLSALCLMVLSNIDMVLIKHYFTADEAGRYAVGAILGRIIFYFPAVIVMAFFPIVAEAHALKKNVFHLMYKGLLFTAILSGVGTIVYAIVPELIVSLLFGAKYLQIAPLLKLFGFAMLPIALINIIINFNLARHKRNFVYTLLIGCVAEVILICFIHNTLAQVLYIMIGVSVCLFIINYFMLYVESRAVVLPSVNSK